MERQKFSTDAAECENSFLYPAGRENNFRLVLIGAARQEHRDARRRQRMLKNDRAKSNGDG
jgi:hypothetical protein